MRTQSALLLAAGLVVGLVSGGAAVVVADPGDRLADPKVKACVTGKKVVRGANADGSCPKGTKSKKIAVKGATGATGAAGPAGATGATGAQGPGAVTINKSQALGGTYQPVHPLAPMVEVYCDAAGSPDIHVRLRGTTTLQIFGMFQSAVSAPSAVAMPFGSDYDAVYDVSSSTSHAWYVTAVDRATGRSVEVDVDIVKFGGTCNIMGQVTPSG